LIKWLVTLIVALVLLSALAPWLARAGFGRLPGDLRVRCKGREYPVPITSTILLSAVLSGLVWLLRL